MNYIAINNTNFLLLNITASRNLTPLPKDMLRKRGIHSEVEPSYPKKTEILNQQLHEDESVPLPTTELLNDSQQPQKWTKKTKTSRESRRGQEDNPKDQPLKVQAIDDVILKRQKITAPSSS